MFPANTRFLVIDDMLTMRKLVIKALKESGYTDFVEAADGALGWEQLNAANPPVQVIVSDWNMPNMTGLELLKKCRADAKWAKVPFLLVTAEAEKTQIVEAIQAGVSNYVVKPFTSDALKEKLLAVWKKVSGT